MADSASGRAMTQQMSWMQRIPIGRTLQLLAGKFKYALGFGGQSSKERELLVQRDDLQQQVDSLLADKHGFASKTDGVSRRLQDEHEKQLSEMRETYTAQMDELKAELEVRSAAAKAAEVDYESKLAVLTSRNATLDEDNKRYQELREVETQAHHNRVESMQVQLDTGKAELEVTQTRFRDLQMSTKDESAAQQAHSQSIQEQLKGVRENLELFKVSAEERNLAQRAEIDAKAQQVMDLQAKLAESQLQLDFKDSLLRSTLKDLKVRPVDFEDERVRSVIMAIESGLPQMTYPPAEKPLPDPLRKSYQHRMRQMQAARQKLLHDSKKQPASTVSNTESETVVDEPMGSGQSALDDDGEDRILEYVLSSMKVALPRSVAGKTAEVFFEPDDDYPFPDDKSDSGSSSAPHSEQQMPRQAPTQTRKSVQKVAPVDAQERKRLEFYGKWPRRIYSNLPLEKNSIRLVEILAGSRNEPVEVRMAVHELKDVSRQYEALSYVCGKEEPGYWITLNSEKVEIYPNLHNALTWLRQPTSTRRMWIDAICINQRSKNEKSKEIQNMGPVYNQAKTVHIFLGAPALSETDSIRTFMRFLNRGLDNIAISPQIPMSYEALERLCAAGQVDFEEVCQGFIKFCLQPWWRRIWTMQEFYLAAEEPLFYWGEECCSTASLKRDFELLEISLRQRGLSDLERDLAPPNVLIGAEVRRISRYISRCYRIDDFDSPRRLYSELTATASDLHDYIYGLRAMFDPIFGKVFVPDYQMNPEMLFACLAVYLVVVEGWADLLWWYPTRYRHRDEVASWWPDFSRRSMPHELDVKPLEMNLTEEPRLNWVVENHTLHAGGYLLDTVYAHNHIDKSDGHKIFSELWQFDHCMNWNHECNEYFDQVIEADDEWIRAFRDMHHARYAKITHFNSSFRGILLQTVINEDNRHRFPCQVAQCVPCWDVLRWHALRIAPPGLPELLGQDTNYDEPGYLENIFSPRMRETFREAFADFFIGACIFDWGHLSVWLRRFPTASQWIASNHQYWASTNFSPSNNMKQRSETIVQAYNGYVNEIHDEIMRASWCYSFYYVFLAYVILLDCDDYASLANMIQHLQKAAEQLRQVYFSSTIPQMQDLAPQVPAIAYRLSRYFDVLELFRGRYLLWTTGGFRGISCPGVETCGGSDSVVVIIDGLSFPAVVSNFNAETGEGRLAGCVLLRGVDMLDRDTETAYLPPDYIRGNKRMFKLR